MLYSPHSLSYMQVQTVGYVVADGKSNWLEGLILICEKFLICPSAWTYAK